MRSICGTSGLQTSPTHFWTDEACAVDRGRSRSYTALFIGVGGSRKGKPVALAKSGEKDNALRAPLGVLRRRSAVTKRTSAKDKLDRRMGENFWGRPTSPVTRRDYGPGLHGQRRTG